MELLSYKNLQEQAKIKKKGMWENYEGPTDNTQAIKEPEFSGTLTEVLSGDHFIVKSDVTKETYRVNLSNVRAPKSSSLHAEGQPWGDHAKEFMRKRFIGKKIFVKVDEVRLVKKEDREFTITNCTISYQDKPIAVPLLEKGLAKFRAPRGNEQCSLAVKEYALATEQAEADKLGLFSNKDPVTRQYFDVTRQENKKKFKADFLLSEYKGWEEGIIEHVF